MTDAGYGASLKQKGNHENAKNSYERAQASYEDAVREYDEAVELYEGGIYRATREGYIKKLYIEAGDKVSGNTQLADISVLENRFGKEKVLTLSAKTLTGVEEFTTWLKNYVYGQEGALGDGIYVQNVRHENLLREALRSLEDAKMAAEGMLPYDCIVIDVRNAIDMLGEITGDTVHDEIINEIFSRFCIGK